MSTFIGQLIGFAVIALILWRYVVPPVRTLMQKQQEAVRTALAESAEAAKKLEDAWLKWQDAALEIEQLRVNSSWEQLTKKGGIPFVSRLAEIYFVMKLNVLHVSISNIQTHQPFADVLASDVSKMAMKSLKTGYWMEGYRWSPSTMHKAKFWYRYVTIIRLTNDTRWAEQAVHGIGIAHTLLPDDAAVARERDAVVAWKASLR